MISLFIALIAIGIVGNLLYKRFNPQGVLLVMGLILLFIAAILGTSKIVDSKSTGLIWFDVFLFLKGLFSKELASLGLTIMSIGGFVRYMEKCGANKALVELTAKPLKHIHSPIAILIASYTIGQILDLFIPSHAGLGLLLMLTMYPIMVAGGMNKLTAVAVIVTAKFTDIGPLSSNAILAAKLSSLDPVNYFVEYQLPVVIPAIIAVGIMHCLIQPWWEKREKRLSVQYEIDSDTSEEASSRKYEVKKIYAILPVLPLFLVITFSPFFSTGIKLDVVSAMLVSTFFTIIFEIIVKKNIRIVLSDIMTYFEGMAKQFKNVVSLIIAAELFGKGLIAIGTIDALIKLTEGAELHLGIAVAVISVIMLICAFIMGSGNAAFFAFSSLAPKLSILFKANPIQILLPMELSAGFGRAISPITPAIIAMAGIAGVSPFHVAKRCAIPVLVGFIVNMISVYIYLL